MSEPSVAKLNNEIADLKRKLEAATDRANKHAQNAAVLKSQLKDTQRAVSSLEARVGESDAYRIGREDGEFHAVLTRPGRVGEKHRDAGTPIARIVPLNGAPMPLIIDALYHDVAVARPAITPEPVKAEPEARD